MNNYKYKSLSFLQSFHILNRVSVNGNHRIIIVYIFNRSATAYDTDLMSIFDTRWLGEMFNY